MTIKTQISVISAVITILSFNTPAKANHEIVNDDIIKIQRAALAKNTANKGFGPQSPRNIDNYKGENTAVFSHAPTSSNMNLCNIHFHKNAEHAGGEFSKYAGNGNGKGFQSGYLYSGTLTKGESKPAKIEICPSDHGALLVGDTIVALPSGKESTVKEIVTYDGNLERADKGMAITLTLDDEIKVWNVIKTDS